MTALEGCRLALGCFAPLSASRQQEGRLFTHYIMNIDS